MILRGEPLIAAYVKCSEATLAEMIERQGFPVLGENGGAMTTEEAVDWWLLAPWRNRAERGADGGQPR